MTMKPLRDIHLQRSIHLSTVRVGCATLKTETLTSLRNVGPKADNETDMDVKAAATMCQYAYYKLNLGRSKKTKAELIDGWKPMTPFEVDMLMGSGFNPKLENAISGFNSMLFQKQANGIRYFAYCTEGTDMKSVKDWFSNFSQGLIGFAPQYTYSVQMAKKIDNVIGNKAVLWFIGHSLGGGLASNNSLVTGRHAITFNAAGLNPLRVHATLILNNGEDLFHPIERTQRIHAFVLEGEILNSLLGWIGQSAYGSRKPIKIGNQKDKNTFQRHALTTLLDKWKMKHD